MLRESAFLHIDRSTRTSFFLFSLFIEEGYFDRVMILLTIIRFFSTFLVKNVWFLGYEVHFNEV